MANPAISGLNADCDKLSQIEVTPWPIVGISTKTSPNEDTQEAGTPPWRVNTKCNPAATGIATVL